MQDTFEHLQSRASVPGALPHADAGFDPPDVDLLRQLPWSGPGPDPLGGAA